MGFWSKLKDFFKKKDITKKIKEKNDENSAITQQKFDVGLKKSSDSLSNSINNIAKNIKKLMKQC